jgi:hypothetical protein
MSRGKQGIRSGRIHDEISMNWKGIKQRKDSVKGEKLAYCNSINLYLVNKIVLVLEVRA